MNTVQPTRAEWELPHSLGSIRYQAARGRYEIRLRERAGEPQRSTYVRGERTRATYALAERELADRISASTRSERVISRSLTVGAWLDEWLELKAGQKSAGQYAQRVELYLRPLLGRHRLADLEAPDVQRAMQRLATSRPVVKGRPGRVAQLSPGTVDAAFRVLDTALADAWDLGRAPRNACRGVKVARPDTLVEPPTLDELERLFAELAGDPWLAAYALMRETGARLGEVLGLERRHVDTGARTVTYSRQRSGSLKTRSSRRTVAIPQYVADLLEALPARIDTRLVFATSSGRPLDQRNVLRHFDAALERAGIAPDEHADLSKYRQHDLRHAFATTCLEAGVSETIVGAWLGHSGTAMLKRYSHVRPTPGGAAYRRLVAVWGDDLELAFGLRSRSRQAAAS